MNTPKLCAAKGSALVFVLMMTCGVAGQDVRETVVARHRVAGESAITITKASLAADKRLTLKGWSGELKDAKVVDLAGNDISILMAPKREDGNVTMAHALQPFVMKTKTPQLVNLSRLGDTVLPGGLVLPPAKGSGGAESAVWFRLFCAISPQPARYEAADGSYTADIKLSVRASADASPSVKLPHPVVVSLGFEGMTADNVPDFSITQAGLEHQKVVALRFRPTTGMPKLLIRSTISDTDLPVQAMPRIELRPVRSELLGFGLETVVVKVARVRADGEPATGAVANVDVEVNGSAKLQDGQEPVIPADGSRADFVLRSSGLGKVVVRATVGGMADTTELNQRFPSGPLFAALFGGALGGLARRWTKGARKDRVLRQVAEGTVVALVAFVAAVLGVGYLNLPAMIAATEAGAFLTGAISGFAGVVVLSAITNRLKPAGETGSD